MPKESKRSLNPWSLSENTMKYRTESSSLAKLLVKWTIQSSSIHKAWLIDRISCLQLSKFERKCSISTKTGKSSTTPWLQIAKKTQPENNRPDLLTGYLRKGFRSQNDLETSPPLAGKRNSRKIRTLSSLLLSQSNSETRLKELKFDKNTH